MKYTKAPYVETMGEPRGWRWRLCRRVPEIYFLTHDLSTGL